MFTIPAKTDLVLFTKWDRFSRNAPDAYQMIHTLKVLGVEPQAIEQPLDMSVPENKMMLAIYLTAPEIENDRRALNTFYGLSWARYSNLGGAGTGTIQAKHFNNVVLPIPLSPKIRVHLAIEPSSFNR